MKEDEIRPRDLFRQYLDLARDDAETFFVHGRFVKVCCPACGETAHHAAFCKFGFEYVCCSSCGSLYTNPRPSRADLSDYYANGKAVKFWQSDFYRQTAESRRGRMFEPRAAQAAALADTHGISPEDVFLDVGAGYGIFCEVLAETRRFSDVVGVEPSPGLAGVCSGKGFKVIAKSAEELQPGEVAAGMASAFEVLEHVFDPREFLTGIGRVLSPGGILLFTTLSVSGFDMQILWEQSNSIFPPHHLNLLSVEGMRELVGRSGFQLVELSTPGKLDVDIVANAVSDDEDLEIPRFMSYLLNQRDTSTREDLQTFLRTHLLSSHIRVVAKKPS